MGVTLRPHKVVAKIEDGQDLHALVFTEGDFAGIIFSYENVKFTETDGGQLKISFTYYVHSVPDDKEDYDRDSFKKELSDFLVELLFYGLEKDKIGVLNAQH
jgi:hypothetical protein